MTSESWREERCKNAEVEERPLQPLTPMADFRCSMHPLSA